MDWGRLFAGIAYCLYCVLAVAGCAVAGAVAGMVSTARCYVEPLLLVGTSRLDRLPERTRGFTPPADADPAVPDYLHGPALADLVHVLTVFPERFRAAAAGWSGQLDASANPPDNRDRQVNLPATAGFGIGLMLGVAPGMVLVAAVVVAHALVTVLLTLLWRATGLLARVFDSLLLRLRNIRMLCVACFEAMPYPAYRCPRCTETHWDIRPGPLGIIHRTCRCGQRLPTLLLFGSASLPARCPGRACGAELPHGPGTSTELVLPIFGATGAGKTRLMYALVVALEDLTGRPGVNVAFADEWTEQRLADARIQLDPDRSTAATPPALQRGLVIRMRVGRRRRMIQLFDAAGERFASDERTAELRYISRGRTFVLVIDPLSVDGFWDDVTPDDRERLEPLRPAGVPQPDLIYQQSAERILDLGGAPKKSRLAVVFSRADVLTSPGREDLEAWARRMGLAGLIRSARHDFSEVKLFHTAAITWGDQVDSSIPPLLTWLLRTPEPATSDSDERTEVSA